MTHTNHIESGGGLERLTTRLTARAFKLLQLECTRRYRAEAGRSPYGKILSELIEQNFGHLWPDDGSKKILPAATVRKRLARTA